ncbi:MAG: hypothetical protein WAT20_12235 [Ferruginibacter sp.]|nr:hypothetical protein [Chitinophagaceae bacterium]
MEDRFIKYSKLYALIFLLFLCVPVLLGLVIAAFYGISKLVSSTVADITFGLGVVTLAPAIFMSVYFIFFKRTKKHPAPAVKIISQIIFVAGFLISLAVLVFDMISFFTKFNTDITGYYGLGLTYLAGNVAMLFLIAIVQAFTTKKEVDWMERHR